MDAERRRLIEERERSADWKRWGPYLADRQWGTVREDYSASGDCWNSFPHDHARSRAYRWGEDGLFGFTDRGCRLCIAPALWNGVDPILKERLFGLTNGEGNHGEDVKEIYHHLDATPTASYAKALYRYPISAYPYADLVAENNRRGVSDDEYELADTNCLSAGHTEMVVEYAKAAPEDILQQITVTNRSDKPTTVHVLLQVWFRNTWIWGCRHEGCTLKPQMSLDDGVLHATHESLGDLRIAVDGDPEWLFTENETNTERLYGHASYTPYTKDAFHRRIVGGDSAAVSPLPRGTKAAAWFRCELAPGASRSLRLRLRPATATGAWFGPTFTEHLATARAEADTFYRPLLQGEPATDAVQRQAYAGMIWTKKFYHLVQQDWQCGDPDMPPPERSSKQARNRDWGHLFARDVLSMPDGWEYPWFAAWDLAFHCIPLARIDPDFAKQQLELLLREWYMHPNGQIPAYEFAFGDVNPPVHAWAAWRVYRIGVLAGDPDVGFLERVFQKLLLNFTWWVNRKDVLGRHVFSGGFLGLDNIGVFDRSKPLPGGSQLVQADGTAWMAFYAARMLAIALELARYNPSYEDIASKFFEHFVHIADALNHLGGKGLWEEDDGFYYDRLIVDRDIIPLRVRSMVGIIPLFGAIVVRQEHLERFPAFAKRLAWFERNRDDLARRISWLEKGGPKGGLRLLAIPSRERLERVLQRVFDEAEFLAPHGIRSLSKFHEDQPYTLHLANEHYSVGYEPGESRSNLFGGNSNWRGPVWFPVNHLLIESLREYHEFYGDSLTVELPRGSGHRVHLGAAADEIGRRLASLFMPDANGRMPCHGSDPRWHQDANWQGLPLFYEYFHGDTGQGLGASHQTGWTALVSEYLGPVAGKTDTHSNL